MILASVQTIEKLVPHPNADSLSIGEVLGWKVVVKTTDYHDGDKVVFIFPDTIVPANETFAFMEKTKYRVFKCKFRGEWSFGLVMPISIVSEELRTVGTDVSTVLGITKYEKPEPANMGGNPCGSFPIQLANVTDEDNLLSNPNVLLELARCDLDITLKMDGCSATYLNDDTGFVVCSRKFKVEHGSNIESANAWSKMAHQYTIENVLKENPNLVIQGEVCGAGIQNNRLKLPGQKLFVFNVYIKKHAEHLKNAPMNYDDLVKFCQKYALPIVPHVKFHPKGGTSVADLDALKQMLVYLANAQRYTFTDGSSIPAEGIVIRPTVPTWSNELGKWLSVKIIDENYSDY